MLIANREGNKTGDVLEYRALIFYLANIRNRSYIALSLNDVIYGLLIQFRSSALVDSKEEQ